ncbi:peptidase propeptide and YPEB domain protein [Veillonella atypica ACS-134-V-Col7a]|uniref:Peptidase propeptide and YPEB domain protein n=2 Tax=Veillonella atypica TaxID=39777 RepID=E1LBG9_9FIRM|nr:ESPR-type extended signal peptide-containing protein [Veillonella atypica]EFL58036.1 peptidase propeptide and YPEB domain protein [Veillonella atypica ACS-134-V-Col7a]
MGLNHIYKVIWSKTKNAWVVVSEIAKRDGKSSVKSVVTSLAGKSVAAVMVAMVMCGGVATANTVYGPGATTGTSTNVTVVGDNAQVDNYSNNAVVIGSNAKTKNGTKSISIGSDSSVDGQFGIAIGAGATLKSASTFESIVIGYNAKNEYADVVIGRNSSAKDYWSTVVGGESIGVGQFSTLIGFRNIEYKALSGAASQTYANSILGHNNSVMGGYNTILGQQNIVNSNGSVIATGATGVNNNIVVGNANSVRGNHNIVLGTNGSFPTFGDRNIVIGQSAGTAGSTATPSDSIGIGTRALTYNNNAIALGTQVTSSGQKNDYSTSIAIGHGLNSDESIVIGAKGTSDTSFNGMAGYRQSIMVGYTNDLFADNKSVIIGSGNKGDSYSDRSVNNSVILGSSNTVKQHEKQIIVGSNNYVRGKRIVAIGNNINADSTSHDGAVIIGDSSRYSYFDRPSGNITVNGINIDSTKFAGNSSTLTSGNYMSVGDSGKERQIKNVAAGQISSSSTDAVNGSQLYEAVRAVTVGASPDVYMHVNNGVGTQAAGNATTNFGKANEKGGATGNRSIAIGVGSQASGQESVVIGSAIKSASDNIVAIGNPAAGNSAIGTNSMGATLIGYNSVISDNSASSSVFGSNSSVLGTSSVAINNASVNGTNSVAINGAAGRFQGINQFTSNNAVAINGVAKGNNNIAIGGSVGYSKVGDSYLVSGSNFSTPSENSIAIGNNTLVTQKNTVMVGTYDKEYTAKANIDKNKVITPALHTAYYTLGAVDKQYYEGTLNNSVYLGHESYAFTPDALVDDESHLTGEQSIHTKKYDAAGNIVVSNNTTGGAFGKVSKATINGDEITGFAGAQSVGAVTIGAGDYERRIQNVAAGEVSATSTDGINGSQLYAVANTLSKNMSSYMHINDGTSTQTVGNATTNYGYSGSKAGATGNLAIAGGMNAKASGQQSLSLGSYTKSEGDYSVVIGSSHDPSSWTSNGGQTFALGNYSVVLGRGAQTWKDNSIAIGHRAETLGEDSIAIGKYVYTGAYSSVPTERGSGITAVGIKLGVDGINTNVFGQGKMDNIGGGQPIRANDSTILGNRNQANPIDSHGNIINFPSINEYATGNHILGNDSLTAGNNAIVIGNKSFAYQNSVALGYNARAIKNKSIALGYGAFANGENSISIGTGNAVEGAKSSAIGDPSYIDTTATGTHVQGNDNGTATNPIKASESTFMGNTNLAGTASTTGIHVVGNSNSVDSSNVMVMGNNVTVGTGLDGAVVLGHASTADQYAAATDSTINGVTFEAAGYAGNTGLNKGSIVSVGATGTERQIKNVAAGAVTATSTDAVNGSQLYKTAETILKMPINMAGDSGDTVGLKLGKTVNIKGSVASGADVTDGNIAVVGDKATSTLSLKMAKNLTGLTSGTFTDATGNQTVINGGGVTVTPTGTGATPISITTSGINAGNQEIKGVKKGTTDDAAVNKKQMDDALAGISSTLTINDGTTDGSVNIKTGKLKVVGESGANALVTTTVSGDTITVGTSTKLQNAVTAAEKSADKDLSNLSATGSGTVKTLAQDAVKVAGTGLATVSDATAAGVKTYTVNVDEGKLVIDDTTGKIGAAGASQGTVQGKDGVATTQNVASVVNSAIDKTKQALDDAKHNFAGDDATVISRKHGEQLNIKGGASTTATDLTSGNIAVVGDTTSGTLNIKMAKALTGLTSATYTDGSGNTQTVTGGSSTIADTAGNSTVVSKGGVTTTDAAGNTTTTAPTGVTVTPAGTGATPISVTTSGISAGNKEIKNVANGTTDDAAVNKKQMDDALKGATDNTVSLGSESGTTTAKKLSTTGGIKFNIKGETGANALITTSASGDDVTIAPTAKLTAAVTAAEKSADKDLSNLSAAGDTYIKNLAKTAASWNVETNGAGTTAVAGGDTLNFIDGDNIAITNTGRSITIGTAKNVSFDKVTVGGIVLDKNTGINAGNKEIKGVANATSADAAVNKGQMDAAITAAASGSLSTEKVVAKTLTGDNNLVTVAGQTGTAKGETYEVSVSENAVKAVAANAAQDAVKVAGTGLATVSDATAAGVKTYTVNVDEGKLVIDDTTGKIGANGATQGTVQGKNGVATTQNVADVVNSAIDKTKQALTDAKHDFAGDDATVISRKHGEQLNIKGGASTTATDLTSGNIAVVGDTTSGTLNIKMAKALTGLTSATYTDAAGNTQTVTGGSSTISDAAGNSTVVSKGGVTTTDGTNTTTVAPAGVTATDGTHTVTLGGSGISAGGTEIKNVGKATTDDAAVNKKQMDDAVKAATDSVSTLGDNKVSLGSDSGTTTAKKLSTTGGIKFNIKGETGANALITTSATGDDVTIAPTAKLTAAVTAAEKSADKDLSNISPAGETVIKNLAATSAQDAVKVTGTGLATVSDSTTSGVKTYNVDVKTGNLVVTAAGQAGAAGTTGAGGAAGADGVATTQNVASAINDAITKSKTDTAQAIADAEHKFDGDTGTTSVRKHGEVLSVKGGVTATTDLTTGNIGVVSDGAGTLNIRLAKVLSGLTSATYTDAAGNTQTVTGGSSTITDGAGNTTTITKGGMTTTDGTNTTTVAPSGVTATDGTNTVTLNGSGIDAGNTQIKNVGKATTDDAAVNKKQMDDAVKAATDSISTLGDNKVSLGSDSGTTTAKKLSTTGGIKFNIKGDTGANALISTSATGDDVTIAPTAKLTAAVTAAEKSADKDLSNLSAAGDTYIKNLAKTAASWNVETNGAGTTAVAGGETVNFINGDNIAITNTGRSITIGTAKNVSFDKVTVGGIVLDKNTGINAGGKEIKGVANATSADAAVNKGQLDAAVLSAAGGALSIEKVEAGSVANGKLAAGDNNLASVSGLTGTAKNETYTVTVSENAVKAVAQTAAQDAVKVAGTGLATVSDATAAGVKTYTVNVDEGKLVIDDTTGKIGANGATQGTTQGKNGVATTQDVASVVNSAIDKTKQALTDAKHDFAGDDATVISRKHGEQLNIKGGASTTATDLTSGNIAVVGDTTTGTLNIKLAKALTGLTSATYTDAAGNTQTVTGGSSTITDGAGNTTTITKGGMTTTDGTNTTTVAPAGVTATDGTNTVKLTGSGIDAGNTQIKNVGKATTDDAAVNKKQMDDAVKAATDSISTLGDNKVSLGSDSGTTTAKKLSTTGGIKFNIKGDTGANALITTSATGDDVTIAPTAKLTAAVTAAEKSADKDLSNISPAGETVIKNLAATSAQDAVKVTGTGLATVSDSTTGGVKTYNVDVKTGNLVVTAAGQAGATGTTGAGGAAGADGVATTQNVASAINDAITKSKTDTAQAIADVEHKFDGDTGTTSVRKHGEVLSVKGGVTATTDLTTGNIGVVSDGAGTLNIRLAKVLSGLTSASFTNAGGDSTVINGNGVTITPSATGASPISMTTAGINAGNKEIKGVANATSADAAVNKAQMDAAITAAAGGSLSTEKVVAKTLTGDTNLATVTGQTGTAKGETYEVAVSENAVKAVAQTAAQDAVKVTGTGLANVTDSTTGGVKTYNVDVKTGNLVVTAAGQVGANGTTGAGGAAGANGVATTQNVASAINDAITKSKTDTAQAIADAEHKFDGDTGTTSVRKHGEVLSVKGGVTATTDLTTGNIGVVSDGAGTLNIRLAKVLSGLTSATYTDAAGNTQTVTGGSSTITDGAGNTTTITKGGMTTTDGTNTTTVAPAGVTATDGTNTVKLNGSGIDAGNTQIKNVGKATTDDAAVNKKQMDDAVKAATDSISTLGDNKVSLGSDSGTTTAKKLSTTGGIKFNIKGDTGANALITTSATGDDVTIAPTAKLSAAVTAAENSANKDLSNLSAAGDTYIKNLAKTAASWNVETNGAGTTAVTGGDTVNFINGDNIAITNTGRSITIGTAKNVSFDKVTVGGVVIDKNNGIDAGGKEITNVGPATSGNSAVNKTQMDTAIANAQTAATSTEKVVAKTLTGDTNLVTVTGQTGTAKGETYEVAVSENAVKAVAQTAAQDAVKVTGTGLANVTDSTTGGVKTYNVDVKTGNLVVNAAGQAGAAGTTGAGGAAGADGVATTQNVASAINDAITKSKTDTAQAIADAEHKFDGDTGTTSVRKHGEILSIKGGVTATTDLTTGNIGVVSDGAGTLNIRLAKTLTGLTSAAFTDGTHTVTIAGSGIDAGNTEIKHVGKATTDDAAVNKKQMDDAVKAATDSVTTLGDNKVSLGSDSGTTTAKKLSTPAGIKFNIKGDTGANALITTSATGDDVTIAPTAKLSAAVTAAENSANKDLSNLSTAGNTYIQNLAKSAASWNVETNGAGTTAVAGGDTVNFINGDNIAITNTGRSITIGTAKNVSFDKVTVGGVVIDKNNGIDAGGKEITNVGPATSGNSAVNKTQMDTAITNAVNKATTDAKHDFGGDDTTVVTRKHGEKLNIKGGASTTAADLTSGNIAVLGDAATGTLNIRMAKALTGLSSATFTTPSGTTVINGGGMTITPSTTGAAPISITTGGINAGNTEIKNVAAGTTPNSAVNKQQMDSAISNATANVGFSTAGNTGTGSVSNGQTLSITGTNGIETNASGQSITVGLDAATRAQINNATTTANNAAKKDLSNIDNAGKQVIKDTAAWNVKVNGAAAETVKGGDTVTFNDGDNIKVTNTGKDITIATKKDVSFDKVTVGNVVIDKNTSRISGLANAANNDEAVNLGQMNAAISTATAGTGNIKYKANGGTQNSVALTTGFDFKGDSNIQITADPANSGVINYKLNPALTGITSISGGTGAPTITLNAGSGSTPGNVSINSNLDMGGKQINNIGAATHAGDAVNKAQMDQALQNIAGASSNAAKSYAYKAGAGAAALAALKPIQYDPLEPTQIMAGIGNYKSQTAVALGVAHYTNENTMFNLGVSLDSHDGIVNAGVTHKFGYSPEKKAIPDKYKGGPISSIYVMQDEVTALQAIVQKQAAENEALRQQNEDMQRKVDMILSKIH